MALLKSDKIQAAPRMFLNHELSQALKNERGAKPMKEIVQAADEMKKPSQAISPKNINRTRKVG